MKYRLAACIGALLLMMFTIVIIERTRDSIVKYDTFHESSHKRAERCVDYFLALGYQVSTCKETDDGYDLVAIDRLGSDVIVSVSDMDDEFNYLVSNL